MYISILKPRLAHFSLMKASISSGLWLNIYATVKRLRMTGRKHQFFMESIIDQSYWSYDFLTSAVVLFYPMSCTMSLKVGKTLLVVLCAFFNLTVLRRCPPV